MASRRSNLASLVAAIAAAPDDDQPRLVYADALAEGGEPLGEMIHIQIAIAQLGYRDWPKRKALQKRERESWGDGGEPADRSAERLGMIG